MAAIPGLIAAIFPKLEPGQGDKFNQLLSGTAYEVADAMMKAREK